MKLKYECCEPKVKQEIDNLKSSMNDKTYQHIQDLYELINYQINIFNEKRREIISMKHHDSWKHYDKDHN